MSADETRIYDRAEAIARLDGDEGLFAEMAEMFVAECDTYCGAVEAALTLAAERGRVYTYGHIIHNEEVVRELEE